MRILLVHDYAPPLGGAEVMNTTLIRGLRERGHEVRRLCSSAAITQLAPTDAPPEYVCTGTTSRWRTLLQSANPWAPGALRRAIREFRPDVVHAKIFLTQLSPLILPVLRDVPTIYHAVWYRAVCPTGHKLMPDGRTCESRPGAVCYREGCLPLRDWVPLMAQRAMLQRWRHHVDLTVANSRWTASLLEADGVAPVTVVPNGVPVVPARQTFDEAPSAVYVGRLSREKGVDVLLDAFAQVLTRVPAARLTIIGDGPLRAALEAQSRDLQIGHGVRFMGHLPRTDAESIARTAWVQVIPSRWAEPFGIVAAEAMMRGTAVVATDAGGLAELVHHELTGLRVPPGNVDTLAVALSSVLGDRGLAERFGTAAREVALRDLTEDRFVTGMLDCSMRVRDMVRGAGRVTSGH